MVAYIYPPFFAELLAPLTPLGLVTAARVWLLAVNAAFIGSLWVLLRINPELSPIGRRLLVAGALGFMPVYLNLKFQQVATLWLLLLALSLWAALRRRDALSGGLIALAASLKVTPVFFLALFFGWRRWRLVLAGVASLLALTFTTMLAAPQSWQFFTVVLPRIGLGTDNWDNGSLNGLISRIVELAPSMLGSATPTAARIAIALGSALIIGVTLWQARPTPPGSWSVRLGAAALTTALLIASSVTWQHHLVTLLLPITIALAWLQVRRPGAHYAWLLLLSYGLCWIDRRALPLPADLQVHSAGEGALVLAGTSIKLAGLLLLWSLLLLMVRRERQLGALSSPARSGPAPAASAAA